MKTYITLALDARHLKKDGTYPVILRVTHFQEVATILTGIYLRKDDWDAERRKVKPSHKGSQSSGRINNYLDKKKADAQERVLKLHDRGLLGGMGVKELKKALEGEDAGGSFFEYAEKLIGLMKERNENGNARTYSFTVGVLRSYVKQRDLFFREISPGFLRGFEHEHFKKGKTANGLSTYLRTIRAIYNKAIAEKVVDRELYPFSEYKIKGTKTAKRAIKGEAILKIQEEILSEDHVLFHARNYFLLSFYFGGMPFVDLAYMKVSNLKDGRLHYERQKTGTPMDIEVSEEAQGILDGYLSGKSGDDFILPIITATASDKQYNQVMDKRRRYNRKLKELAQLCGIQEKLTSYVSRHSFATRAKNLGIPVADISEMLGHKDIRTTQTYLDSLPSEHKDAQHKRVTSLK